MVPSDTPVRVNLRAQTAELNVGFVGRLSGLSGNRPIMFMTACECRERSASGVSGWEVDRVPLTGVACD